MTNSVQFVVLLYVLMTAECITYEEDALKNWINFKAYYNKSYPSLTEELMRLRIFLSNRDLSIRHRSLGNNGIHGYTLALNKFADWTEEERLTLLRGYHKPPVPICRERFNNYRGKKYESLPGTVDWYKRGAVTKVKDVGKCGSSYAIASVEALEGQNYIKTGKLIELSAQSIIDCSKSYGNDGCNGGSQLNVYEYIQDSEGIDTLADYPYEGVEKRCRFKKSPKVAPMTGYDTVTNGNEKTLAKLLALGGPLAVAIDASPLTFTLYKTGIYRSSECNPNNLNHVLLLVGLGYRKETNEEYWILKNNWSTDWGEQGYMKLLRNKNNTCGIASFAVLPVM